MYNEATRGKFKDIYHVTDADPKEQAFENDWTKAIQREQMQLLENRPFIAHYTSPEKS
jgi:hypothetical protein